ncbi:eukaryotic translation initiation factor 4E1-like [Artemia franciscana]|uniref:Eukaryotic translation initiation factor 4E n=1 Tax=Artemia franciscana TaxID=6661 RepID=A0AA88IEC9_ARTSF|nr:hypothetical protein QYM36_001531 [Artemia franciscana]
MNNTSSESGEGLEGPHLPTSDELKQWTFYMRDATGQRGNWDKTLQEIHSFDTVKGFWELLYHMAKPSQIKQNPRTKEAKNISIFRKGISPRWEDPANSNGGRFEMNINADKLGSSVEIDKLWEDLILLMIGENFGELNEKIHGVDLAIRRREYRLSLWVGECDKQAKSLMIEKIKSISDVEIRFENHTW